MNDSPSQCEHGTPMCLKCHHLWARETVAAYTQRETDAFNVGYALGFNALGRKYMALDATNDIVAKLTSDRAALLEALERMVACVHPHQKDWDTVWVDSSSIAGEWRQARAAIAQAKGQ